MKPWSSDYFPAFPAFSLAHLFRCAAAIFLRADGDIVRLRREVGDLTAPLDSPFTFAHLALAAAAILARPEADILCRRGEPPAAFRRLVPPSESSALIALSRRSRSARSCLVMSCMFMGSIVATRDKNQKQAYASYVIARGVRSLVESTDPYATGSCC